MQKKGNFFLAHLLQNAAGRAMMRFPEKTGFGNIVTRSLAAPHQGMKTLPGNAAFGFGRGLSPEVGIIGDHFGELGEIFQNHLKRNGMSVKDLTRRDVAALQYILRGDFQKAYKVRSPVAQQLLDRVATEARNGAPEELLKRLKNPGTAPTGPLPTPPTKEQMRTFLAEAENVYKNNRLTGNLARMFGQRGNRAVNPRLQKIYRNNKDNLFGKLIKPVADRRTKSFPQQFSEAIDTANPVLNNRVANTADAAANALLAVADPGTMLFNGVKRLSSTKHVKSDNFKLPLLNKEVRNPVKPQAVWAQEQLQDAFMGIPLEGSARLGYSGRRVTPMHIESAVRDIANSADKTSLMKNYARETLDAQVMNPFTSAVKDLANGFGYAAHKAGLTSNQLNFGAETAAKALGKEVKKPDTWYRSMRNKLLGRFQKTPEIPPQQ